MIHRKKAVILLSGGLDSATCLGIAKAEGYRCYALSFSYGQRHLVELKAARRIAKDLGVVQHEMVTLPISALLHSALTDPHIVVPQYTENQAIPVTYVPARNTIFLSIALGWAESLGAQAIFLGASSVDYSGYPDCRPEFFIAFQQLMDLATKSETGSQHIQLICPLSQLSKAQTIRKGLAIGVDYALTVSCYQADAQGRSCGHCDSCVLRKRGFEALGLTDPAQAHRQPGHDAA